MTIPVTIVERRVVELTPRSAAEVAERVVRERFNLGDATTIEAGKLTVWLRDESGRPEPQPFRAASVEDTAALLVAMALRRAWQTTPAP